MLSNLSLISPLWFLSHQWQPLSPPKCMYPFLKFTDFFQSSWHDSQNRSIYQNMSTLLGATALKKTDSIHSRLRPPIVPQVDVVLWSFPFIHFYIRKEKWKRENTVIELKLEKKWNLPFDWYILLSACRSSSWRCFSVLSAFII